MKNISKVLMEFFIVALLTGVYNGVLVYFRLLFKAQFGSLLPTCLGSR